MMNALKKLYRRLFHFGGHGVHSPFVFRLITEVIEEKRLYYCYEPLSVVRKQLSQENSKIAGRDYEFSVKKALKKYCFTECEARLLFRLANHFQPKTIYLAGSDLGLAPLYLTAYSENARCFVFEPSPSVTAIAQKVIDKSASSHIQICDTPLDRLHIPNNRLDLVVWGNTGVFPEAIAGDGELHGALSVDGFNRFLPYLTDESVMVVSGIHASRKNCDVWKAICRHSEVSVTLDLCSLGIVFFNPKLHRRTYKSFI